jgi:hypothetical protein
MQAPSKPVRRISWGWLVAFAIFYMATVMPVGLFLYTVKMDAGLDIFKRGGFHAYLQCLEAATGETIPTQLKLLPPASATAPHNPAS